MPGGVYDVSSLSVDFVLTLLVQQHCFLSQAVTVLSAINVSYFFTITVSGRTILTFTICFLVVTFIIRVATTIVIITLYFSTIVEVYCL